MPALRDRNAIDLSEADTALWWDQGEAGALLRTAVRTRGASEVAMMGEPLQIRAHTGALLETIEPGTLRD